MFSFLYVEWWGRIRRGKIRKCDIIVFERSLIFIFLFKFGEGLLGWGGGGGVMVKKFCEEGKLIFLGIMFVSRDREKGLLLETGCWDNILFGGEDKVILFFFSLWNKKKFKMDNGLNVRWRKKLFYLIWGYKKNELKDGFIK